MEPQPPQPPKKLRSVIVPGAKNIRYEMNVGTSQFDKDMADLIIERMMDGMYLTKVLKALDLSMSTIVKWEKQSPDFKEALNEARKALSFSLVDSTLEDAEVPLETMPEVHQLKTKIENKRWVAEKYNREQFGAKLDMSHSMSLADVMDSIKPSTEDEPIDAPIDTQIDTQIDPHEPIDTNEPIDAQFTDVIVPDTNPAESAPQGNIPNKEKIHGEESKAG